MINTEGFECQTFIVPEHYPPLPLAQCLRRLGISLNLRRKIKQFGYVRIDGAASSWNVTVQPRSEIQIEWSIASQIIPEPIPLTVAYEDDWLLIVNKPAGMLVHPTSGQPGATLANAVIHRYRQQGQSGAFHPVQRLDKNTSGLLVIAKTSSIHHLMTKEPIRRRYAAVAAGTFKVTAASINLPIARRPDSIILRMVSPKGQHAVTHYRVLQSFSAASLLQLELETGRTHQIRLHLSHIGHPLLGDDLYGGETLLISRQALHCACLELSHPITGAILRLTAPLPQDMRQLLLQLATSAASASRPTGENNNNKSRRDTYAISHFNINVPESI